MYSEVDLADFDQPLFCAEEILEVLPEPRCLVTTLGFESRSGLVEHFRVRFDGLPFDGRGGTVEEAAEDFEQQSVATYERWADIPEKARAYTDPAAFLWIKLLAATGNLQAVIVSHADDTIQKGSAFPVANGA